MTYEYKTNGTCSTKIEFELENDKVHNVRFTGGCNGNLKALSSLVEGLAVDEVIARLSGIHCGAKPTSCGDQLAKALQSASVRD